MASSGATKPTSLSYFVLTRGFSTAAAAGDAIAIAANLLDGRVGYALTRFALSRHSAWLQGFVLRPGLAQGECGLVRLQVWGFRHAERHTRVEDRSEVQCRYCLKNHMNMGRVTVGSLCQVKS